MHVKTERRRHLYGWDSAYATMTPTAPESYKYPDGIVLTLKTSNHAEHYFVERAFALQLATSIKESLVYKNPKQNIVKSLVNYHVFDVGIVYFAENVDYTASSIKHTIDWWKLKYEFKRLCHLGRCSLALCGSPIAFRVDFSI